ncbi:hypothetical protein G6514_007761 [Epicoccum nigrum]|nr:hypothetical protein G6514_007761 [Epicoccum nigrum]
MRNDSDTPSSDLPSPPTPPDGSSLEVLISPTGTKVFVDNNKGVAAKEDSAHGTLYYDYSEQFDREEILEPEVNPIQTGSVQAIKKTQVGHGRSESRTAPARGVWRSGSTVFSNTAVPGMVELPASPVARRITRDMILQALEPASTTEGVDDIVDGANLSNIEQHPQHELVENRHGSASAHPTTRKEGLNQRFSILSQADSSLINSSTLEFAVRYSIPIVSGGRLDSDAPLVLDKESPLAPDMALTTEVDMSDLLASYQHTESRHKEEGAPKRDDEQPVVDSVEDRDAESSNSHAHRSSDPDSFKSATDVLESEPSEHEPVEDARSNKSCPDAVVAKTPSVKEVDAHSFKTAQDAVTPGRSVSMPYPGGLRNLPDLKEESHEDSSLNPSAGNSKKTNFRFSDDGLAGVGAWIDDGAPLATRSSMGSHRRSARSTALGQTRALPSMNFSQMNLLEKVDEVLQLRSSRSLDDLMVTPPEPRGGTPQRPVSAGNMREKYRSFCDRLDQLNLPKDIARTEITRFGGRRVRSPRLLAEIEQVTVPSVNGLTERLSELLPSLKEYYRGGDQGPFAAEEMIMEHAIEDIHEVGGPVQKRSLARLRPLPGSLEMVVIEDVLYTELTNKDKGIRVIVAPGDESVERAQSEFRASEKTDLTKTTFGELEAPPLSLHRSRTLTVGHANVRESAESGLTRRSLRSFTSTPTPTDTRPWNLDKNYPWASSKNNSIDISLPGPTVTRQSPRPGPSHLRNTLSSSSTVSTFTTPVGSPFGSESESSAHARQLHRFGILARNDQTHVAGERYPTSALTPPTAIFRDNFSGSEVSDDDIESQVVRKGKFSLKKRFSSARHAAVEDNTRPTNSKSLSTCNNPLELAMTEPTHPSAPSIIQDSAGEARAFTSNRHTFRNAQGMPSAVYHRHRIIDHLKR